MKKIICMLLLAQGGFMMAQTKTFVTVNGEKVTFNPTAISTEPWFNAANGAQATANNQDIFQLGKIGIGTIAPHAQLQLGNTVADRKIVLYEDGNNDNQFYGFGVQSGLVKFQGPAFSFNSAVNATSSMELMRLNGTGLGIGTTTPGAKLDVAGKAITQSARIKEGTDGGAPVAGYVATAADTDGNIVWKAVATGSAGDNLGDHTATKDLQMSGKNINNVNNLEVKGTSTLTNKVYAKTTALAPSDGVSQLVVDNTTGEIYKLGSATAPSAKPFSFISFELAPSTIIPYVSSYDTKIPASQYTVVITSIFYDGTTRANEADGIPNMGMYARVTNGTWVLTVGSPKSTSYDGVKHSFLVNCLIMNNSIGTILPGVFGTVDANGKGSSTVIPAGL
ncbi:MAG: hypothetical protein WAM46_10060 [Flavobacterium sp.]